MLAGVKTFQGRPRGQLDVFTVSNCITVQRFLSISLPLFNGYQCTVLPWQPFNCQNRMNVYIIQFEEDLSCINDFWVTLNIIRNLKSRIFFGPVCWRNENTSLNVYDLVKPKGRTYKKRFLSNSAKVRYGFAEETPFPVRLRFSKGDFLSEELFDSRNCKIISRMKEDTEWCSLNA